MRQQRGAICLVKVLAVLNLRTPLLGLATIYASPLSTQPASPRVMHRVPATVRLIPMLHFAQSFQSQYQIVGLRLRGGEEGSCRRDDADVDVVVDDGGGKSAADMYPDFVAHRLAVYERVVARIRAEEQARTETAEAIQVSLPDGKV
jgi:hypothetical protein